MTDATVLGLGLMGSALATALLRAGLQVTVWNRSPDKASALEKMGASCARSVREAVEASRTIFASVADYAALETMICVPEVEAILKDKVVVQLSTGSPNDAERLAAWASQQGACYLDGSITVFPNRIGARDALILVSGDQQAYERSATLLKHLAGDIRYLGARVGAAAIVELAILAQDLGSIVGFLHGALMCESEGVAVTQYADLLSQALQSRETIQRQAAAIVRNEFGNAQATLGAYGASAIHLRDHAKNAGINGALPNLLADLFESGMAAGLRDQDYVALIKVLREQSASESTRKR